MKIEDFKALLQRDALQDLWWLALDDTVLDEQLSLAEIADLRKKNPKSAFTLLNIAFTEDPDAEWLDLDDVPASVTNAPFTAENATAGALIGEIRGLKDQVFALQEFVVKIHDHFIAKENLELKEVELREREKFLEESEESLLQKIQQQEEQLAELENLQEEVEEKKADLGLKAV